MKKILFTALMFTALLFTSCDNDDILIEKDDNINEVNVTVSLTNFFSNYTFQHKSSDKVLEDLGEVYRTFNSEDGMYIQTRVLFYNGSGLLVDSILNYSSNTNAVSKNVKLAAGNYTAVATLTFAYKNSGDDASYWFLAEKESLNTAYLLLRDGMSQWSIMSIASKEFTVSPGGGTEVVLTPAPKGALCYGYFQNFQYASLKDCMRNSISDNGVRQIGVYSQNYASGYKLNPKVSERYVYEDAPGSNTWYPLFFSEPSDSSWTYFKNNIKCEFYVLAPQCNIMFGYRTVDQDESNFYKATEQPTAVTINNGETYLAYFDWLQKGNPYFGRADNNHWNVYSAPLIERVAPYDFVGNTTDRLLQSKELRLRTQEKRMR